MPAGNEKQVGASSSAAKQPAVSHQSLPSACGPARIPHRPSAGPFKLTAGASGAFFISGSLYRTHLRILVLVQVRKGNVGALARVRQRDRTADAGVAARDQRDLQSV